MFDENNTKTNKKTKNKKSAPESNEFDRSNDKKEKSKNVFDYDNIFSKPVKKQNKANNKPTKEFTMFDNDDDVFQSKSIKATTNLKAKNRKNKANSNFENDGVLFPSDDILKNDEIKSKTRISEIVKEIKNAEEMKSIKYEDLENIEKTEIKEENDENTNIELKNDEGRNKSSWLSKTELPKKKLKVGNLFEDSLFKEEIENKDEKTSSN